MSEQRFPAWISWFASHRWGRWVSKNIYTPADKFLYKVTRGRRGLSPRKTVLLLETTVRKTGKMRQVPILYLRDGDRFWVMASNYGQPHHPAWSSNLLANPLARVTIGDYSTW